MKKIMLILLVLLIGLAAGGTLVYVWMHKEQKQVSFAGKAEKEKNILFYRNPMNPKVTSPVPMKDEMGMDYIPVYEEDAPETEKDQTPGLVKISPEKIQKIGIKSAPVERKNLSRIIRTVGRVEPVEDKVFIMNAKVTGWVERLYVNRTDQMVSRGDKLLEIYSPELISAQEEYLLALKGLEQVKMSPYPEVRKGAQSLVEASKQRLKYWDISEDQIKRLKETGTATRTLAIRSPGYGSVTEKMVVEGQKIEAGETLFKIIDHSSVWVYGEIYEYEMPYIREGQSATLTPAYSPNEVYKGTIEHIYSHLGSIRYAPEEGTEVRTEKVRFALPNKDHRLKLGMYLNVEIAANIAKNAIAVPDSALIDSGTRQLVVIDNRDGTFEPREVKTGPKGEDYFQILQGVSEGEWVVTSANFLVDSESNLKTAISGMQHDGAKKETPAPAPPSQHKH